MLNGVLSQMKMAKVGFWVLLSSLPNKQACSEHSLICNFKCWYNSWILSIGAQEINVLVVNLCYWKIVLSFVFASTFNGSASLESQDLISAKVLRSAYRIERFYKLISANVCLLETTYSGKLYLLQTFLKSLDLVEHSYTQALYLMQCNKWILKWTCTVLVKSFSWFFHLWILFSE